MEQTDITNGMSTPEILEKRLRTWSTDTSDNHFDTSPETKKVIRATVYRLYIQKKPVARHERVHLQSQFFRGNRKTRTMFFAPIFH